jgi:hypothetical protein
MSEEVLVMAFPEVQRSPIPNPAELTAASVEDESRLGLDHCFLQGFVSECLDQCRPVPNDARSPNHPSCTRIETGNGARCTIDKICY